MERWHPAERPQLPRSSAVGTKSPGDSPMNERQEPLTPLRRLFLVTDLHAVPTRLPVALLFVLAHCLVFRWDYP